MKLFYALSLVLMQILGCFMSENAFAEMISPEQKAKKMVQQMTLSEKIVMMYVYCFIASFLR
jgi:hypothetical protein